MAETALLRLRSLVLRSLVMRFFRVAVFVVELFEDALFSNVLFKQRTNGIDEMLVTQVCGCEEREKGRWRCENGDEFTIWVVKV